MHISDPTKCTLLICILIVALKQVVKKVDSQFSEIAQKIYKMHKEVILMHQQIDNHNWKNVF